jgi:peptidoglycan/xylan/chitin deacetylase (PgdA/CDA1 family)
MATEITRCRDVLIKLTGTGGRFFRPSGTDDGLAVPSAPILQQAGIAGYDYVLGWDVDPFDYQDPGGGAVRSRVLDGVKPGSIVSMHFGHSGTADAITGILDGLDQKGLKAVTTSALLGLS